MNPRCELPGCGLEMVIEGFGFGATPDTYACLRDDDAHALCAKLAESEAKVKELEAKLEKEERRHLETIDRRDAAEEAVSQMYYLITGNSPHWSNVFGYAQAIEDVDDAQIALHTWGKDSDAKVAQLERQLMEVDYALIAYRHFRPVDDAPACQKAYEAALERSQKRRAREEARKKGAEHA